MVLTKHIVIDKDVEKFLLKNKINEFETWNSVLRRLLKIDTFSKENLTNERGFN